MLDERFWNKVKVLGDDDCWEWQKDTNGKGYGKYRINNKRVYAHRLVAAEKFGDITDMVVRHTCDNTLCVNPNHIEIGTQHDNLVDCIKRNRGNTQKLSYEQVEEIYISRKTQTALAEEYGVSQPTISAIKNGKRWSWHTSAIN